MIFNAKTVPHSAASSASAWIPLLYESIVFGLSLNKYLPELFPKDSETQNSGHTRLITRLLMDSLAYYSVILAITATLTIMTIGARDNVKNITAQTELLYVP